jgi:hypothetical protein
MKHEIRWIGRGRKAEHPSDPKYPLGKDVDATGPGAKCKVSLPYPARGVGMYFVKCHECGLTAIVTAAGRPDDPRSITLNCKAEK